MCTLLISLPIKGQNISIYNNNSRTINLKIDFNHQYIFSSVWWKVPVFSDVDDENNNEYLDFNWSEGNIITHKDTLICIDRNNKKKIYLLKEKGGDILKVINWNDYKNRNEKSSWHLGWNNNADKKVFLDDLLKADGVFYIRLVIKENKQTAKTKLLKVYKWNSGIKTIEYEAK